MEKYNEIETAFSQIKGCTGNSDVKEMVTKFMTKEQTYAHLLKQVAKGEKRFDELSADNEVKRAKMQELKIANEHKQTLNRPPPKTEREQEEIEKQMLQIEKNAEIGEPNDEAEYARCSRELQYLQCELEQINEKKKNFLTISDSIGGWTNRTAVKLNT